jgi:hypothetical protein
MAMEDVRKKGKKTHTTNIRVSLVIKE